LSLDKLADSRTRAQTTRLDRKPRTRYIKYIIVGSSVTALVLAVMGLWLGSRAMIIRDNLEQVSLRVPEAKANMGNPSGTPPLDDILPIRENLATAQDAANDPVWKLAGAMPWLGVNFSAVTETTTSLRDVVEHAAIPLLSDVNLVQLNRLGFSNGVLNFEGLKQARPQLSAAAEVVKLSHERLTKINAASLIPPIADPLSRAEEQLTEISDSLDVAADVAYVAPVMAGADGPRKYLLIVQNNSEARATGGIPGALAVLSITDGKISLQSQTSASALGPFVPAVPLDSEQEQIYSVRMGKFMQDVNLTPDFPSSAEIARAMWEERTGQGVDGVISIDPIALGYILNATGPVRLANPAVVSLANGELPTELDSMNVVPTLLSDVYSRIEEPSLQDAYFAGVSQEIFAALSNSAGNSADLIRELSQGADEGRVSVWSARTAEQSVLTKYSLSGSIAGPSVQPAEFGVYFNDGTGAKMDYYVKRTVQLVKECSRNGYHQTTVRVTSTNAAPEDAATSLPSYVTGGGAFGVPPGSVQTNIVAYGPFQATVETARLDGQRTSFAPYLHSNRPVGVLAVQLAPGESKTVDITFGKIVQRTEPNLVVTPTTQHVSDVILPTKSAGCAP
jgi:hypothetical protein